MELAFDSIAVRAFCEYDKLASFRCISTALFTKVIEIRAPFDFCFCYTEALYRYDQALRAYQVYQQQNHPLKQHHTHTHSFFYLLVHMSHEKSFLIVGRELNRKNFI